MRRFSLKSAAARIVFECSAILLGNGSLNRDTMLDPAGSHFDDAYWARLARSSSERPRTAAVMVVSAERLVPSR